VGSNPPRMLWICGDSGDLGRQKEAGDDVRVSGRALVAEWEKAAQRNGREGAARRGSLAPDTRAPLGTGCRSRRMHPWPPSGRRRTNLLWLRERGGCEHGMTTPRNADGRVGVTPQSRASG
jgi:hypothetical protein